MQYRKEVAFIDRENELAYLDGYIADKPESILFIHGPKSSGKTTLLYHFLKLLSEKSKVDIKFLNLREVLIVSYKDFLKIFFGMDYNQAKDDVKEIREYDVKVFKVKVETLKGMESGQIDPFVIMKKEFQKLVKKGIKPIIIIDELQALENIYLNGQRELIKELFNFFVAMTKESHLAHVIIASSDGYFVDTVYNDSKLKKCSKFFEVNYLSCEDTFEWLLNLEKYSKIKDYSLNKEQAQKIWDTVGGSMWEIQSILSDLFHIPLDKVLDDYKMQMRGMIDDYIGFSSVKKELLSLLVNKSVLKRSDIINKINFTTETAEEQLQDMVRNNILYYDPTKAVFYPQGKSIELGISLYFEEN
jgi:AAA+ ATPase superfamily predicted ATPase